MSWGVSGADHAMLLAYELAAWDSLSDGQSNKAVIGSLLAGHELMRDYDLELSLCPSISSAILTSDVGHACRAVMEADSTEALSVSISYPLNNLGKTQGVILAGLLLNIGVWTARLLDDDQCASNILALAEKFNHNSVLDPQIRLVKTQLGNRLYDSHSKDYMLARLVSSVVLGEPLGQHSSDSWNRYDVALICMMKAKKALTEYNLSNCAIHALHALHCLKFSESIKAGNPILSSLGHEGLLSILYSERAVESVIPAIPPLQRLFVALECVSLSSTVYEKIGYIPGASWLLHRGIEYIGLVTGELIPNRLKNYEAKFRSRLKRLHLDSNTVIVDPNLDKKVFQDAGLREDIRDHSLSIADRLKILRTIVEGQHALLAKRGVCPLAKLDSLNALRVGGVDRDEPRLLVLFTWDAQDDRISIRVRKDGRTVLEQDLISPATEVSLTLINNVFTLMETNKELISSTQDSKEFWAHRREIDANMSELLERIQSELFPEQNVVSVMKFLISEEPIIWLDLPDLLIALPIESLPIFQNIFCVRWLPVPGLGVTCNHASNPGCYVINPDGSCQTTESTILPILQQNKWIGKSGSPTLTDHELLNMLSTSRTFIYSGHGGGEKHWSGSVIQRLVSQSSRPELVLLMGCSSANPYGDFKSVFSTPFHYIVGGCSVVVGTLWDVLGRELDRFSGQLISDLNADQSDFSKKFIDAKSRMKLPNLSAASLVVYSSKNVFN
jgi:hypothetical protein